MSQKYYQNSIVPAHAKLKQLSTLWLSNKHATQVTRVMLMVAAVINVCCKYVICMLNIILFTSLFFEEI
jgi:hypothetical protein